MSTESAASMFPHNINKHKYVSSFWLESLGLYTGWTACSVREWMWCTKMEADGNQSGTPKSKVVSFLCNSTRGAFSSLSSIDHATFSAWWLLCLNAYISHLLMILPIWFLFLLFAYNSINIKPRDLCQSDAQMSEVVSFIHTVSVSQSVINLK